MEMKYEFNRFNQNKARILSLFTAQAAGRLEIWVIFAVNQHRKIKKNKNLPA